jgi:UMF1 family MFS transporter
MTIGRSLSGNRCQRTLHALAVDLPELRAWALYDWANSGMVTVVIATIFPIYFYRVAGADLAHGAATRWYAIATTLGLACMALLAPVLGAVADYAGIKKKMLGAFLGVGVLATACMYFVNRGDWLLALALFVLAEIGVSGSFVFYDSLLPHVARAGEADRLSSTSYALGYLGGGLLLALNLAWIQWPGAFGLPSGDGAADAQGTLPQRLAFVSVAVWWVVFSIPLFRKVREPARQLEPDEQPGANPLHVAYQRLGETFREVRGYRQACLLLVAFLFYSDGISTIYRMAAIYGTEIGIEPQWLMVSILVVQFVGIPFAILFGLIADKVGSKPAIFLGLIVYLVITIWGYFMRTAGDFLLLAILVGVVQGGTQALSRSLFASLTPKHKSAEFFSLFALGEKIAGVFGPAVFALAGMMAGSSRYAIISVVLFFILGGAILYFVDVAKGQRAAQVADASTRMVSADTGQPKVRVKTLAP